MEEQATRSPTSCVSTSQQSVVLKRKNQHLLEKAQKSKDCVGAYAVQCHKCFKWRLVPTKEEFETIRQNFTEDPWFCNRKPNVSCDDPDDIECEPNQIWVIDKPNLPKTPPNTERMLTLRKDFSKMDAYYIMPNGKKLRSYVEVEKFLEACPEYKDTMSTSDFSFTSPKVYSSGDMISMFKANASAEKSKKQKTENSEDDQASQSDRKNAEGEASADE